MDQPTASVGVPGGPELPASSSAPDMKALETVVAQVAPALIAVPPQNNCLRACLAAALAFISARSGVKSITWRVIASFYTLMSVYLITGGNWWTALYSGIADAGKLPLYYFHELVWGRIRWQRGY